MKLKKLIPNILACVGMILLILPMCLTMYTATVSVGSKAGDPVNYNIFADWSNYIDAYKVADKTFASAWATITDVIAIVLLVLAVVYVVMFVLQLLKVGGKKTDYTKPMKGVAMAILVLTVVALITAIIFTSANSLSVTGKITNVTTKYTFGFGVGAIMLLVGGVLTGVSGLLANWKK